MTVAVIACAARNCSASSRIGRSLRATSTRSKPSPANSLANSMPKPLDAPVINAVRRSVMRPRVLPERRTPLHLAVPAGWGDTTRRAIVHTDPSSSKERRSPT